MSDDVLSVGTTGGGVTPKTAYHHGDLRAQLIAAVRDLVETHGPDGFSVAEAARRAGVSSAAPYKHFKDRDEILRCVAAEAMDRLYAAMAAASDPYPAGSHEAVAAIGQAYVDFAKAQPGVFRLVFGLTDGHENAPELQQKGDRCFGVVVAHVATRRNAPEDDPDVLSYAYILWSFVHGHSFLAIDMKHHDVGTEIDDWAFLMRVSRAILAS
ncbi:TetR/AcrR family transcriptional regulator [Yoonia vestfoldensis]|uniref:TetR/AcrR family transcriptional regulator n=1 Tax=Yoonia vestfoldensis TaxID=245188 RepID=UPI000360C6B6|nr:TetR/AcrR family transcriptional regulator [Yoonia vestfoldensis]